MSDKTSCRIKKGERGYPYQVFCANMVLFSLWCNVHRRLIGKIMGTLYSVMFHHGVPMAHAGTLAANLVDLAYSRKKENVD